jgi:phage FluMu protein Com
MKALRCSHCKKLFRMTDESAFLCPGCRIIVRKDVRRHMTYTMRFRSLHREAARAKARLAKAMRGAR